MDAAEVAQLRADIGDREAIKVLTQYADTLIGNNHLHYPASV